jgi:hypothetical protein
MSYTVPDHLLQVLTATDVLSKIPGADHLELISEVDFFDPHSLEFKGTYYYGRTIDQFSIDLSIDPGPVGSVESFHRIPLVCRMWDDYRKKIVLRRAGVFGEAVCPTLLDMHPSVRRVVAYSGVFGGFIHHILGEKYDPNYVTCPAQTARYFKSRQPNFLDRTKC